MQNVLVGHESLLKKSLLPRAAEAYLAGAAARALAGASAPVSETTITEKSAVAALAGRGDRTGDLLPATGR